MKILSQSDFPDLDSVDTRLAIAAEQTQLMLIAAKQIAAATDGIGGAAENVIGIAQIIATNRLRLNQ